MKIGIIGAGNIGETLTRRLTALGHEVAIANSRTPDTLADLAAETGATAVEAGDAPRDADLVIVAIPENAVLALPAGVLDARKPAAPVVDTGNYYPQRDGRIDAIEDGTAESTWVSDQLGTPVVKAFNNMYAESLLTKGEPAGTEGRIALPVASDDPGAKRIVLDLVDQMGFDAVDAGSLAESWRQQPGSPAYGAEVDRAALTKALAAASPERPADFRA